MSHDEITQYPSEFPCEQCGGMVDLTSIITVSEQNVDGTFSARQMTEAAARNLLSILEIPPPPVLCDKHERFEITTERGR